MVAVVVAVVVAAVVVIAWLWLCFGGLRPGLNSENAEL
jgi:hypothetical protein